jgi:hypothetical protein
MEIPFTLVEQPGGLVPIEGESVSERELAELRRRAQDIDEKAGAIRVSDGRMVALKDIENGEQVLVVYEPLYFVLTDYHRKMEYK